MFMKICPKCRTKHPYQEKCPNNCYDLAKKERNQIYDKQQRQNKEIYHNKNWTRLTAKCKDKFNGLDIYQLYQYNHIVPGTLSHHIEEVNDNPSRQYEISNLIYLSDESHREVHKIYNQSKQHKIALQEFLFLCITKYTEEH